MNPPVYAYLHTMAVYYCPCLEMWSTSPCDATDQSGHVELRVSPSLACEWLNALIDARQDCKDVGLSESVDAINRVLPEGARQ